jgi:WS/DGAT/MGAT family acyltransferase
MSALDASFLYLDRPETPMHVGGVLVFDAPGFNYDELLARVSARISMVPRYRQRVREVPLRLSRPIWVDDEDFDLEYHVRRTSVARPGGREQLDELAARLFSRPLDHDRPLWEMYLIEGLEHGRVALVTKTHQAMIDGLGAVDIEQVILDREPSAFNVEAEPWVPRSEPSSMDLVTKAFAENLTTPALAWDVVRTNVSDISHVAGALGSRAWDIATTAVRMARTVHPTPLNVEIGAQRRIATADYRLESLKDIRRAFGVTVNDVALAVIAGALRAWLMTRGAPVTGSAQVRAMVPISTRNDDPNTRNNVSAFLVDLPVGEPDPVVRLRRIAFELAQLKDVGQLLGADAIISAAGFGPPTLHALGARLGANLTKRVYNLVITNAPGPQHALYLGEARMVASYPFVPLTQNQALGVGFTSYDGGIFLALTADREAMPDLDELMSCLADSLAELRDYLPAHD